MKKEHDKPRGTIQIPGIFVISKNSKFRTAKI